MNDNNDNTSFQDYRITLIPLGKFFFGGMKLTEADGGKDYYIKSLYFPQQTVILGMLRYELLIQNQLIPLHSSNKEKAALLIGESSFEPGNSNQNFGVIEAISPVFLQKGDECFHVAPRINESSYVPVADGKSFFNHRGAQTKEFIPYLKDFKAKDGLTLKFVRKNAPENLIKIDEVFKCDEQIGIKKVKNGQKIEEGYYKQVFLRFEKGYAFSFFLRLNGSFGGNPVKFATNMVLFGGERSTFKMEVKPIADEKERFDEYFNETLPEFKENKIVLMSDTFVEPDILNLCDFSVSDNVRFRNFRSFVNTTQKYSNLIDRQNDRETPFLGEQFNILSKGSVLFYNPFNKDNPEVLNRIRRLLDKPEYQKIGFNYYKIYPSTKEKGKE